MNDEIVQEIPVTCRFFAQDGKDMAELSQITANRATACTVVYAVSQRPDLTQEYPAEWQAYQAGKPQHEAIDGTPLTELPGMQEHRARELQAMGIKTVEMVAGLNDQVMGSLGLGGMELREQARNMVKARQADAKDDRIAALEGQIGELTKAIQSGHQITQPQLPGGDMAQAVAAGVAMALQQMGLGQAAQPAPAAEGERQADYAPQPTVAPCGASPAPAEPPQAEEKADDAMFRVKKGFHRFDVVDAEGNLVAGPFNKKAECQAECDRLNSDYAAVA